MIVPELMTCRLAKRLSGAPDTNRTYDLPLTRAKKAMI